MEHPVPREACSSVDQGQANSTATGARTSPRCARRTPSRGNVAEGPHCSAGLAARGIPGRPWQRARRPAAGLAPSATDADNQSHCRCRKRYLAKAQNREEAAGLRPPPLRQPHGSNDGPARHHERPRGLPAPPRARCSRSNHDSPQVPAQHSSHPVQLQGLVDIPGPHARRRIEGMSMPPTGATGYGLDGGPRVRHRRRQIGRTVPPGHFD